MKIARKVESGLMAVNGANYRNVMLPFGGFKLSGMSKEGYSVLKDMYKEKVIVFKEFLDPVY
jgi:succinate-semialdehyde dehydrogenase/glutarate-semialdehyde dehydrogenase